MLGSTIFVSKHPKYWNPYHQKYSILPRPLHLQQILEKSKEEENEKKKTEIQSIIKLINFLENKIPQSLKLGQTCLTQLVIVGDFVQHQNEILSHFDVDDFISCIIILGEPRYGGETMYYNGVTQVTSSDVEIKIFFQHC